MFDPLRASKIILLCDCFAWRIQSVATRCCSALEFATTRGEAIGPLPDQPGLNSKPRAIVVTATHPKFCRQLTFVVAVAATHIGIELNGIKSLEFKVFTGIG